MVPGCPALNSEFKPWWWARCGEKRGINAFYPWNSTYSFKNGLKCPLGRYVYLFVSLGSFLWPVLETELRAPFIQGTGSTTELPLSLRDTCRHAKLPRRLSDSWAEGIRSRPSWLEEAEICLSNWVRQRPSELPRGSSDQLSCLEDAPPNPQAPYNLSNKLWVSWAATHAKWIFDDIVVFKVFLFL
jgi:hypothetical protein